MLRMSSSPLSSILAIPKPVVTESGRERKPVKKWASMVDSDITEDSEEEDYEVFEDDDDDVRESHPMFLI